MPSGDFDRSMMWRALGLARRGCGSTRPNPMVGAVVVSNGEIVGSGYHQFAGGPHGEVNALDAAGDKARGATLYVVLEPCNHFGRTPPCTERILRSGVSRVVWAIDDPNPDVSGNGGLRLRDAGIETCSGVLQSEASELNALWLHSIQHKKPYLLLKLACSSDNKIARADGSSQWISSEVARAQVHRLRRQYDAILVGARTVLQDDPRLSNRSGRGQNPLRIVVDSKLRVSPRAQMFSKLPSDPSHTAASGRVNAMLVTSASVPDERRAEFEAAGIEILSAGKSSRVDLSLLLAEL
ncbi:MAG: bifunctional diaminohydroxyphosphoribosylaminopyrimidine deaminase/5-amino-6-(5-phosphoribosylamino)uracil reductase RibD, partial [Planctomycetales bacterium]|nr:bifunctional diaminohydroxyphosphoribosylaminopyrimidine deaminase/5-amino-6-(5-phosphoribosylamino)uracil reductase RibD [Planctomycetales bacterium]